MKHCEIRERIIASKLKLLLSSKETEGKYLAFNRASVIVTVDRSTQRSTRCS